MGVIYGQGVVLARQLSGMNTGCEESRYPGAQPLKGVSDSADAYGIAAAIPGY
jgi:hypothetical protein